METITIWLKLDTGSVVQVRLVVITIHMLTKDMLTTGRGGQLLIDGQSVLSVTYILL